MWGGEQTIDGWVTSGRAEAEPIYRGEPPGMGFVSLTRINYVEPEKKEYWALCISVI